MLINCVCMIDIKCQNNHKSFQCSSCVSMSISTLFLTIVCTCVEVNSDGQADIKMSLSGGLTMIIVLLIVINKTVYLFETLTYFIFYPPLTYFIFYPPLIASFQWRLKSSSTCEQLQRRGCCWRRVRAAMGTRW